MMDVRLLLHSVTVASVGAASRIMLGQLDATRLSPYRPGGTLTGRSAPHITVQYKGDTWEATLAPLFRMAGAGLSLEISSPAPRSRWRAIVAPNPTRCGRTDPVAGKSVELR